MITIKKLAASAALAVGATAIEVSGAGAASANTAEEQQFMSEVYPYAHPSLTGPRLLQLGYQSCGDRRSGLSSRDARDNLWLTLSRQGVLASNAELGSLVHVAMDTLCPEVGYP
jgi:hypothetical protein